MPSFTWHRNGLRSLLAISLAFNAGFGTTFAVRTYQCRGPDNGLAAGASSRQLHERLDLTPEQRTRMTAAREGLLRQVDELRRELTVERATLAELLATPEPDRSAVTAQLEKLASLQQQVQERVVEHLLEEKALLGPEQREIFDKIIHICVCPHDGHGPGCMPGCETAGGAGDGGADAYDEP